MISCDSARDGKKGGGEKCVKRNVVAHTLGLLEGRSENGLQIVQYNVGKQASRQAAFG